MVVKARRNGVSTGEKQEVRVDIDGNNRRRRIMDMKFSFRRKKKSRLECEKENAGDVGETRNRVTKRQQNSNGKLSKSAEDKPKRTLFSKLLYFKRDRRRSDVSHNTKNSSKSMVCTQSERFDDTGNRASSSNDDKGVREKHSCLENGYPSASTCTRTDMSVSISSPNLTTVNWPSFENLSEDVSRGKYASFKRSRASMVFPIETLSTVCNGIHLSNSERQLQQTADPNTNNAIYSGSCLQRDIDKDSSDKAEGVCARNTPFNEYLSRTNDGRSPHPRRRNPCYETFSSPNIFEENDSRIIRTTLYQFTSVENVKEYECHRSEEGPRSNKDARPHSRNSWEVREGDEDDDFVFVPLGSPNAFEAKSKTLSRYISCPGNLETESSIGLSPSSLPYRGGASKPYSSHRRPYSVHESVMSLNILEKKDLLNINSEIGEVENSSEFPPEDDFTLPSKVIDLAR